MRRIAICLVAIPGMNEFLAYRAEFDPAVVVRPVLSVCVVKG